MGSDPQPYTAPAQLRFNEYEALARVKMLLLRRKSILEEIAHLDAMISELEVNETTEDAPRLRLRYD